MAGRFPSAHRKYVLGTITDDGCYTCNCFCGYYYIEEVGGDAGLNLSFGLSTEGETNVRFNISGHRGGSISDQIKVYANGSEIYASDCASNDFNSGLVTIPAGTTSMAIVVIPHCAGNLGSYWDLIFLVSCV